MLDRKLNIFFLVLLVILANVPSALCISSAPTIYISGDGSGDFNCNATNAALEINEALQFVAENSNYTTVYLKGPFTYVMNDTLFIGNSTTLAGDSNATLKLISSANWVLEKPLIKERNAGSHDITIRGFAIDGNREGNTNVISGKGYYNLIHLTRCQNVTVRDMYLTNNHGDGLKTDSCSYIKVYNNTIYELGHDALYASYCSDIEAFNNKITCRTNSGLRLYNSNKASFHDNVITSNNGGAAGIQIQKWGTPAMDNIEIYNNTIYRTALAGIWLFGSNSYPPSSASVHIHHNLIYDTGTKTTNNVIGGILSDGFNALIENNVVDGAYGAGIVQNNVYSPGPISSGFVVTARNNIITNTRTSTAGGKGYGINNLLAGTHSFVLQNNCLYNNSGGDHEGAQASPSDIAADPQYADRDAHDYHIKSKYGRWNGSSWVNDTTSSPCIDMGSALSDYSKEPEDNGDRTNIGLYGGTEYASRSGTSSSENEKVPIFTEKRVTANGSDHSNPAIYGDRIIWQDTLNGTSNLTSEICMYNLSTSKETQITKNGSWASSPAVSGDRIAWEDNRNGNSDIFMYDLSSSTETQITTNKSWQGHPAIYDNRVIWEDYRNGNWDIYLCNLTTLNETQITTNGLDQVGPAIYGDKVVWQDARNGNWDIYLYNLSTSLETRITTSKSDQCNPAISGDRIVWQDARNGNWDIYMYNLTTSTETQITSNQSDQCNPSICGDRIAWQDSRNGNSDIYMYTISESNETQITVNESRQESPAIYDSRIVWNDGRNGNSEIYMCTALSEATVANMPTANFSSNVTQGYAPLTVQFTDLSENATGWSWDFGDGTNSTLPNPMHTYSAAGNYTVNLTATNGNGTNSKLAEIGILKATGTYAYITNYNSSSVSVIDTDTNTVTTRLQVGYKPFGIAVNPSGTEAYVTSTYGYNTVSVINTANNSVRATVNVGHGPHGIAVNQEGTKIYVASDDGTVSIIDAATNSVSGKVNAGSCPFGVTVTPDGKKVYVTNSGSRNVSVINATTNEVIATVNVGSYPYGIAANPQGTKIYVANGGSNSISIIDTQTDKVTATVNVGSCPYGLVLNPTGSKLYVANMRSNSVSVIDTTTNKVVATVGSLNGPHGIAVNQEGTKVYVANWNSNSISAIDTATDKVIATVSVEDLPAALGNFIATLHYA